MQLRYFNSEGFLSKGEEQRTFPLRRVLGISFTCTKSLGNIWERNLILRVVVFVQIKSHFFFKFSPIGILIFNFSGKSQPLKLRNTTTDSESKSEENALMQTALSQSRRNSLITCITLSCNPGQAISMTTLSRVVKPSFISVQHETPSIKTRIQISA